MVDTIVPPPPCRHSPQIGQLVRSDAPALSAHSWVHSVFPEPQGGLDLWFLHDAIIPFCDWLRIALKKDSCVPVSRHQVWLQEEVRTRGVKVPGF